MLFYVDRSIYTEFSQRHPDEEEAEFFELLAYACRHGQCALCGDRLSLFQLNSCLHSTNRGIYSTVAGGAHEHRVILSAVQVVFVLTFGKGENLDTLPQCLRETPQKLKFIQVEEAKSWTINRPCYLIAENYQDCNFYKLVARYYCMKHNICGLSINFSDELGGGNTTCDVLEKRAKEWFALCIIDSDQNCGRSKRYKNEPGKGDTLKRVEKVAKKLADEHDSFPFFVFPIYVREIENLIPLNVLEQLQEELPASKPGVEFLKKLILIKDGEPALYYDLKNGLAFLPEGPQRTYWQEILVEYMGGNIDSMPPIKKSKKSSSTFPAISDSDLLKRANKCIGMSLERIQIDDHLQHYWEELGHTLLTWGCVNTSTRA